MGVYWIREKIIHIHTKKKERNAHNRGFKKYAGRHHSFFEKENFPTFLISQLESDISQLLIVGYLCGLQKKIAHLEKLAWLKNGRIRLPANLKAIEKSRTYPPDLESHVYVKYTHRRNVLKLKICFNWFVATLRKEFKTQGTMYHHTKTLSRDNITFLTV